MQIPTKYFNNIIKLLKDNRKYAIAVIIIELFLLVFSGEFFYEFINSTDIGGVDAWSHLVAAEKYAETFPALTSWSNSWYLGMPWIIGYPPLFYILVSIIPILSVESAIKFILLLVYLLLPLIIFFILKKLTKEIILSIFGALISILFLTLGADVLNPLTGITILATFQIGYYPQALSLLFFLIFLFFLLLDITKRNTVILGLLLSLILLTNIHTFIASIMLLAVNSIVYLSFRGSMEKRLKILKSKFFITLLAFLLSAFWLIPLLFNLNYLPGIASNPFNATKVLHPIIFTLLPVLFVGIFYGVQKKDVNFLSISLISIIFLLLAILPVETFLPNLPIQSHRFYSLGILLVLISTPVSLQLIKDALKLDKKIMYLLGLLAISPLIFYSKPIQPDSHIREGFLVQDYAIAEFMKDKTDGRSLIEVDTLRSPWHYNMSALISRENDHQTIWSIFRESSLNSAYTGAIRNSLSASEENFGVICYLCSDAFYKQDFDNHLDQAKLLGVKYFLIRSDDMKEKFLNSERITFINEIGKISVFELNETVGYAKTIKSPILTFTKLDARARAEDSLDWLRLSEIWLGSGDIDRPLVKANRSFSEENIKSFDYIFVSEYLPETEENIDAVINFLKSGKLLFSTKNNEYLVSELGDYKDKIKILENTDNEEIISAIFEEIDKIDDRNEEIVEIEEVEFIDNKIILSYCHSGLDPESNQQILKPSKGGQAIQDDNCSYYLKTSYHPYWTIKNNPLQTSDYGLQTIYMASPANMLVITDLEDIELDFEVRNEYVFGAGMSILGVLMCTLYLSKESILNKYQNRR